MNVNIVYCTLSPNRFYLIHHSVRSKCMSDDYKQEKYKNDKLGLKSFRNGASVTRFIQQGALTIRCPTQYLSWSQLFFKSKWYSMYWNCRLSYYFLFKKCGFDRYSMVNGCFKLPNIDITIVPKKKSSISRAVFYAILYIMCTHRFCCFYSNEQQTQITGSKAKGWTIEWEKQAAAPRPHNPRGHKNLI